MNRFPRVMAVRLGYDPDQVDAFVRRIEQTLGLGPLDGPPVTADEIRNAKFAVKRGGYNETAVDFALDAFIVAVEARAAASPDAPARNDAVRSNPAWNDPARDAAAPAQGAVDEGHAAPAVAPASLAAEPVDVESAAVEPVAAESASAGPADAAEPASVGAAGAAAAVGSAAAQPRRTRAGERARTDAGVVNASGPGKSVVSAASPGKSAVNGSGPGKRGGTPAPDPGTPSWREAQAARVERAAFRPGRLGMGYREEEVDAFLDRVVATLRGTAAEPLTAEQVRKATFATVMFRQGYAVRDVDGFLEEVASVLERCA
ncbi:hypothetical protein GCM10010116_31560 [Microbispora rosea subsp. aerata]|nr:DivIVA domain-containing protein [Microbispora rosea]GGO15685.1 hypothetical protein GCM10010116_31560 [Microbispora rosea subsp. aerata]GIH58668.1 hypothetical protein Mro02_55820 [Microbispora rosea subsp. aerata]GLJ86963.1 hypothetical protein GCM10017588_57060 [Microbispora rosea subsp. aerata]